MEKSDKIVVIGGSSGCMRVLPLLLSGLPAKFSAAVVIVIHRLRNVDSALPFLLLPGVPVIEPDDKEAVRGGNIYLAPQNYHLLVEEDGTFSLDYSEPVHYSRPSIDVTMQSVAQAYGNRAIAVLLSGANKDGAAGMDTVVRNGGIALAQSPGSAECPVMPQSALNANTAVQNLHPENIVRVLNSLLQ